MATQNLAELTYQLARKELLGNTIALLNEYPFKEEYEATSTYDLIFITADFLEETMNLLIPDRNKDNKEDFVWCLPVERVSWAKWYELSKKFRGVTPDGVRYMNRMEGKKVKTILMLPDQSHSDDDVLTACAWLRMVKQYDCKMYVCRCSDDKPNMAQIIAAAAGAESEFVEYVDDADPTGRAGDETQS